MSMFDLEPLSAGELDSFEKAVFESARDDVPTHEGRIKTLVALGLEAPSAITTVQHEDVNAGRPLVGLSRLNIVVMGMVMLGTGFAVVSFLSSSRTRIADSSPGQFASSSPPAQHAEARLVGGSSSFEPSPAVPPMPTFSTATPEMLPAAVPAQPPKASAAASRHSTRAKNPSSAPKPAHGASLAGTDSTLEREIAAVDAARSELSRGNASKTLTLLDAYDREFPGGAFTFDVAVLRLEGLARVGRISDAEKLAAALLAAYPTGVYARRIKEAQARATRQSGPDAPTEPQREGK